MKETNKDFNSTPIKKKNAKQSENNQNSDINDTFRQLRALKMIYKPSLNAQNYFRKSSKVRPSMENFISAF